MTPDFRDPSQRRDATAGLTQRQIQERAEERPRLLFPVISFPQVEDVKR